MNDLKYFTFDGISSEEFGINLVEEDSGLKTDVFLPTRNLIITSAKNREYFQGIREEPLQFPLHLYLKDWQNFDNLRQIARWLNTDYYKPLYFNENPSKIYYAMIEGTSNLFHNGLKDGYITLNLRCNSPYSYSSPIDLRVAGSTSIHNDGDVSIKPKVWIKTNSSGDVKIINQSTNQTVIIKDLQKDEEVFIDCENEEIVSSLEFLNIYRYKNHNREWLKLERGFNQLEVIGEAEVELQFKERYLF